MMTSPAKIDTRDWRWFRYDDIFDIKKGFYNKKPEDSSGTDIPFIGASDDNNGITSRHALRDIEEASRTGEAPNQELRQKIFSGNCITVSNDGSIGYAFYQEKDFTCSHSVNVLYLKGHVLNRKIALFLCTLIEMERYRWAYGRKWRPKRMPASRIKLPVTGDGQPDWPFMERLFEEKLIPRLAPKARETWQGTIHLHPAAARLPLSNPNTWKWFRYDEVFDIRKGFYNKKPEDVSGEEVPFIGATDSHNGVTARYARRDIEEASKTGDAPNQDLSQKLFPGNCITVSNNGSIGHAFYQEKEFTCTHDVNPLYLKGHTLNRHIAMFLCTLIEKERYRWAYGRKWRPKRMPASLIKLPVTTDGTPDWAYMERYIKGLPYSAFL